MREILGSNPGLSFYFQFYSSTSFVNFYLSILLSHPLFHFLVSPCFPSLFMLTLFIVTIQTNYTRTNKSSEFQTVDNLPFNITPCLQNKQTFLKNQWDCCMPTHELILLEMVF